MRNQRLVLGVGALVLLSVVVAGFVIFSDTPQRAPRRSETPSASLQGDALVVGRGGAEHEVVVREDFGCAPCRAFDEASRDFLRIEAARGVVRVTYRPEASTSGAYAGQALATWRDATAAGSARKALALHAELYDRAPASDAASPVAGLPVVTLDGSALRGQDGTALADALQERLTR